MDNLKEEDREAILKKVAEAVGGEEKSSIMSDIQNMNYSTSQDSSLRPKNSLSSLS